MNREDIIRLAREAGLPYMYETGEVANIELVERFAALVAAHEREECAKAVQVRALANPGMMYMTADQCAAVIRSKT